MTFEAGRVLSGRYRLVRPIGVGSQASVWVAEHLALGTEVGVKLIDPELAKREEARERFRREASAAAQLRSTHVVQILDHGIDEGQPFIVMEILEGEDLFDRLAQRNRLTLKEASSILVQVARALSRAHAAGIVHRDLKPENVFIVKNEDEEVVKVLDFGVAKLTYAERVTMQGAGSPALIGTPQYMSPEQVRGDTDVDFRTDIWALGVLGYQCVLGDLPFDHDKLSEVLLKITMRPIPVPSRIDSSIPQTFDAWFLRSCDRDPSRRFGSARSQAEALARLADMAPDAASRSLPPPRPLGRTGGPAPLPPRPSKGARPGGSAPPPMDPGQSAPTLVAPRSKLLPTMQAPAPAPAPEPEPSYDELAQTVQMGPREAAHLPPAPPRGDLPHPGATFPSAPPPDFDESDTDQSGPPSPPRKKPAGGDLDWGAQSISVAPPPSDERELELLKSARVKGANKMAVEPAAPKAPPREQMDSSLQITTERELVKPPPSERPSEVDRREREKRSPVLFVLVVLLFAAIAGGLALGAYHVVTRSQQPAPAPS